MKGKTQTTGNNVFHLQALSPLGSSHQLHDLILFFLLFPSDISRSAVFLIISNV